MKTPFLVIVLGLIAHLAFAAEVQIPDWTGKTVAIKTTKEGSSCVRILNFIPTIGQPDQVNPQVSAFNVVKGVEDGSFAFESVSNPGMFLRHENFHLILHKDLNTDSSFRFLSPLRGNEGISFQSINFPDYYITLVDRGNLSIIRGAKDPRKAVFFLEERRK